MALCGSRSTQVVAGIPAVINTVLRLRTICRIKRLGWKSAFRSLCLGSITQCWDETDKRKGPVVRHRYGSMQAAHTMSIVRVGFEAA